MALGKSMSGRCLESTQSSLVCASHLALLYVCVCVLYAYVSTCTWVDGRVYTGEWYQGQAHGRGREINPDGTVRHDGEWKYDQPVRDHNP